MSKDESDLGMAELAVAIARVLTTVSKANLERGQTYSINIPRSEIQNLAEVLESHFPGYLESMRK